MSWFVDIETVEDMMKGLPFKSLERSKVRDSYLAKKYEMYTTSAFSGTTYTIVIFYKHKEDDNKNMLHVKVYSPKWGIDKNFEVEKFRQGEHNTLRKLMKKVLLS